MSHIFSGRAVAGLAASLLTVTIAPFVAPPAVAEANQRQDLTRVVKRTYGDGPVRAEAGERVRIDFRGRAGDRLLLRDAPECVDVLRNVWGVKVPRTPAGYWQLPARGTYKIVHRRCAKTTSLQLLKLTVRQGVPNGYAVNLPAQSRGYLSAVEVVVPESGRVAVDGGASGVWRNLVMLDGQRQRVSRFSGDSAAFGVSPWFVEAGLPVSDVYERVLRVGGEPLRAKAGQHLLLLPRGAARVKVTTPIVRQLTVDGPASSLQAGDQPRRERSLAFDGVAGQYVHLETEGAFKLSDGSMIAPDGSYLPVSDEAGNVGGHAFWHLPTTGRYRLVLTHATTDQPQATRAKASVRIRSIRRLAAPIAADGSVTTLATTTPGEWVLGTVDLPGTTHQIKVAPTSGASWRVYAQRQAQADRPLSCSRFHLNASTAVCDIWSVATAEAATQPVRGSEQSGTFLVVLQVPAGANADVGVSFVD